MLRITTGCVLISLLTVEAFPVLAAEPTVAEQAARLKPGRKVRVKLANSEILKGRMGPVGAGQFTIEPSGAPKGTARVVRFDDAQSVKPDGLTKGQKWIIFGVVWVAVGIIAKSTV